MTIQGDFYTWSEENANKVGETPAKYELYDESHVLLCVGSTGNLRERFKHYISTNFDDDSCKQRSKSYKRKYVNSGEEAKRLEEGNLKEYERRTGKLPPCNERIG